MPTSTPPAPTTTGIGLDWCQAVPSAATPCQTSLPKMYPPKPVTTGLMTIPSTKLQLLRRLVGGWVGGIGVDGWLGK